MPRLNLNWTERWIIDKGKENQLIVYSFGKNTFSFTAFRTNTVVYSSLSNIKTDPELIWFTRKCEIHVKFDWYDNIFTLYLYALL